MRRRDTGSAHLSSRHVRASSLAAARDAQDALVASMQTSWQHRSSARHKRRGSGSGKNTYMTPPENRKLLAACPGKARTPKLRTRCPRFVQQLARSKVLLGTYCRQKLEPPPEMRGAHGDVPPGLRCRAWVTQSLPTGARLCASGAPRTRRGAPFGRRSTCALTQKARCTLIECGMWIVMVFSNASVATLRTRMLSHCVRRDHVARVGNIEIGSTTNIGAEETKHRPDPSLEHPCSGQIRLIQARADYGRCSASTSHSELPPGNPTEGGERLFPQKSGHLWEVPLSHSRKSLAKKRHALSAELPPSTLHVV